MIVRNEADWLTATLGGHVVAMSVKDKSCFALTRIGARIWDIIETPRTVDEICGLLMQQFAVPADVCRAEVESFLNELEKSDAIRRDAATAASTPAMK